MGPRSSCIVRSLTSFTASGVSTRTLNCLSISSSASRQIMSCRVAFLSVNEYNGVCCSRNLRDNDTNITLYEQAIERDVCIVIPQGHNQLQGMSNPGSSIYESRWQAANGDCKRRPQTETANRDCKRRAANDELQTARQDPQADGSSSSRSKEERSKDMPSIGCSL